MNLRMKNLKRFFTSMGGSYENPFYYFLNETDPVTATVYQYYGNDVNVKMGATVDGYTITEIGFPTFSNNTSITSVIIPGTVTKID